MSEKYVLFLDILGFSQLVLNNSPEQLRQIYDSELHQTAGAATAISRAIFGKALNFQVLASADGRLRDVLQDEINFHVMSDTVIAWTNESSGESLLSLGNFAATYLTLTLNLGLPHRGAISKGNIELINLPLNGRMQTNVVGSGVVHAHNQEAGQEWMGCVVDEKCFNHLGDEERSRILSHLMSPFSTYAPPYKDGRELQSNVVVNWARCKELLPRNADYKFFENQFGRYGKGINDSVKAKVENTSKFYAAATAAN